MPNSATSIDERPLTLIEHKSDFALLDTKEVWRFRELIIFLVWRDLKVRYKQTLLGVMWAFVQPLMMVLMLTVTFAKWAKLPSDNIPHPVFYFSGILIWNFFISASRNSVNSITSSAALISKVYFPRVLCPVAAVIASFADFVVAALLFIPLALYYSLPLSFNGLMLSSAIVMGVGLFSLGFGLWLGPVNARFRDVQQVLPFIFQLWMYATPIIYPFNLVPESYRRYMLLNPMAGYVEGMRSALLDRAIYLPALYWAFALTGLFVLVGVFFFQNREPHLADYLG